MEICVQQILELWEDLKEIILDFRDEDSSVIISQSQISLQECNKPQSASWFNLLSFVEELSLGRSVSGYP